MLLTISQITAIEDQYLVDGVPSLGEAYAALLARWQNHEADREDSLRLMFLSWYSCSEPNTLTGLPSGSKVELFSALFERLGGERTTDPELMFTVGVMASLFPYCCGAEEIWTKIGRSLQQQYGDLQTTHGLSSSHFDGRGAYGRYFTHILANRST
jgi:hypothetical protein